MEDESRSESLVSAKFVQSGDDIVFLQPIKAS